MLPDTHKKRSFLRFDVPIDVQRLRAEFEGLPKDVWMRSYWGSVHCSVGLLLLRGGNSGTEHDFFADSVTDSAILDQLPYIRRLIEADGPFGGASYAFLFRMEPGGVTLRHQDLIETWRDLYRVHIPIITNPDAYLIAGERSMHLAAGYAWSFDNQSDHGVVNGDAHRTHLIMDVPFSATMQALLDRAEFQAGTRVPEHLQAITEKTKSRSSYPGDEIIRNGVATLRVRGLNDEAIAEFLNAKNIPPKTYAAEHWNAALVAELVPE